MSEADNLSLSSQSSEETLTNDDENINKVLKLLP